MIKNKKYPLYDHLTKIENIKDMLRKRTEETPDAPALSYNADDKKVTKTFRQVEEEAVALGTWLMKQGYKEQKHIAIVGNNSYKWLLAFFAIAESGNVVVPIDKDLSPDETIRNLKMADCTAVFIDDNLSEKVKSFKQKNVFLMSELDSFIEQGRALINKGDKSCISVEIKDEDVCCIVFTSGTSGVNKGVVLTNGNIAAEINYTSMLFIPDGATVAVLPFHHAFGLIVGIFMVYYYGKESFINKNLSTVSKSLVSMKPQTMFLVPVFVEAFHKQIWREAKKQNSDIKLKAAMKASNAMLKSGIDMRKKFFNSILTPFGGNLEYIICGGAALDPFYVQEFRSWGIEILNGYGMTECSPCICVNRNHHHKDGTVGVLEPNVEVRIAHDDEVLVRGPVVMREYYKNPEATAEAITDGWYHTGDLGFVDDDGFLTLTGRKKNLIILSTGENISPEELGIEIGRDKAVCEVLVYEDNKKIVASIFPEEAFLGNKEYFDKLVKKINFPRPAYKHITEVRLRDTEFKKNSSKKILRNDKENYM